MESSGKLESGKGASATGLERSGGVEGGGGGQGGNAGGQVLKGLGAPVKALASPRYPIQSQDT